MSSKHAPVWPIYKRLLGYTRAYWGMMVAAVIAMAVESVAGYHFTKLMEPLVNRGFVNPEPKMAVILPLTILGLFLMRSAATWVSDYALAKTGRSVVRDLREQVLAKYLHLPSSHFDTESTPVMVSRLNFDTEQVTQASADALKTVVADTLTIIAMLAVMLQMSVKVTVAMLVVVPMIGVIVSYVGKRYRRISRGIQDGMGTMAQTAEQSLAAQQEVKVHGTQQHEMSRYSRLANRMLALNMKVEITRAGASSVVQFLAALALAVIVWVSTREALAGRLNAGQFMGLMISMTAIIPSLRRLTSVQSSISRGVSAAERLFDILDMPVERDDGRNTVQRVRGELAFEHVMLRYREDSGIALDDISFVAKPGTVTAIVGRSGSGKTSLIRLVPRFYEPSGGRITLDGVALDDYPLADLRRQVAMVGQKVMLFDDTIGANIAYGMDATDEKIRAAAEAANAWEFIARMPQQLQTPVGENGALLSGGQRQRLAIARALLVDAPVLLFDEATSALDAESEHLIQQALPGLMSGRTTLVIAHRLATVQSADRIAVIDQGRLVAIGSHARLIAENPLYARLAELQFAVGGR